MLLATDQAAHAFTHCKAFFHSAQGCVLPVSFPVSGFTTMAVINPTETGKTHLFSVCMNYNMISEKCVNVDVCNAKVTNLV